MYRTLFLFILSFASCVKLEPMDVGSAAPPFHLRALTGREVALASLRGKVVLINFWATWCGPCRTEMPSMEALYGDYDREDFEILALSIDPPSDEENVRAYVREFGFRFPILLDQRLAINQAYQVRVLPTSFLVDRNGALRDQILGARDWNAPSARQMITTLIREKKSDAS